MGARKGWEVIDSQIAYLFLIVVIVFFIQGLSGWWLEKRINRLESCIRKLEGG